MSEPYLAAGSGPHVVQRWVLEADMTHYEAMFVFDVPGPGYALVCVNVAGGGEQSWGGRVPRWSVTGGGAWYVFRATPEALADNYVAEKFRLNDADAPNVTRLLAAALQRERIHA